MAHQALSDLSHAARSLGSMLIMCTLAARLLPVPWMFLLSLASGSLHMLFLLLDSSSLPGASLVTLNSALNPILLPWDPSPDRAWLLYPALSWRLLLSPEVLRFPGGPDGKEPACDAGDLGSLTGMRRSPGGGQGNPLQYSCPENPHEEGGLAGCSPWRSQRVGHDWGLSTAHSAQGAQHAGDSTYSFNYLMLSLAGWKAARDCFFLAHPYIFRT